MLAQTDHHSIALQQPLPMRLLLPDGSVMNDKAKKLVSSSRAEAHSEPMRLARSNEFTNSVTGPRS